MFLPQVFHDSYIPFPFEASCEKKLYVSPPLTGIDLINTTNYFRFSFGHAYCAMGYSWYMACPNLPIFEALHLTLCYFYHHLPIMYPSRVYKSGGGSLHTHWCTGFAQWWWLNHVCWCWLCPWPTYFCPDRSLQHYIELELDNFSRNYCLHPIFWPTLDLSFKTFFYILHARGCRLWHAWRVTHTP